MVPGISLLILALAWLGAHLSLGSALVPSPADTLACLYHLVLTPDFWTHISITLFRGVTALGLTLGLALVTGIAAGRNKKLMDAVMPLAAMLQATPPILWITLVMVWAGTGNLVPILVVTASLFPPLFLSAAMAAADLDRRFFDLARVHGVTRAAVIKGIILPGIFPNFLAGFSYALGACLKIAAVAEFLGSDRGIGARLYWAYRMLDMEVLFAWALVLVGMGTAMEFVWIRPLRQKARHMGGNDVKA